MALDWIDVALTGKLFLNADEAELRGGQFAALENCFQVETGAIERFPGFANIGGTGRGGRMYLNPKPWQGDLVALSSQGLFYRMDSSMLPVLIPGVPVTGGKRPIFAETPEGIVMAAGGEIFKFDGVEITLLSPAAPKKVTHVQYINGYLVANEDGTFRYTQLGSDYTDWPDLNVFAADSKPDAVNALMATPFNELLVAGADSVEQYEPTVTGDTPFFRRFTAAEGVSEPYSFAFADNASWGINSRAEFVRFQQQITASESGDIDRAMEKWDRTDAWVGGFVNYPLNVLGQKFLLLQFPNAMSPYGAKGITLLKDLRTKRWTTLYGFDSAAGQPARFPIWSHATNWNRTFFGGNNGTIHEMIAGQFRADSEPMRMLVRTGYLSQGEVSIDGCRLTVKRGVGSYTVNPTIQIRCRRDNGPWSLWVEKSLGLSGERSRTLDFGGMGSGFDFQFEIQVTDNAPVELLKFEVKPSRIGF